MCYKGGNERERGEKDSGKISVLIILIVRSVCGCGAIMMRVVLMFKSGNSPTKGREMSNMKRTTQS
jgi:flagellar basal body-associated protein FliL